MSKPAQHHRAKKRFGQNFLQDDAIIARIVDAIRPKPDQALVEIGPGLGALTKPVLSIAQHVTVIELDRDVIPKLQKACAGVGELNIIEADVLTVDFLDSRFRGNDTLRIIGNLPYNISTPLLFHLMQYRNVIEDMHFMLQKEVVDRLAAAPNTKAYGRLSVMMQFLCDVEPLFLVPPDAFDPQPKVDSMIVRLIPKQDLNASSQEIDGLSELVKHAFAQRRKTIWNNLKGFVTQAQLAQAEIDPGLRPEAISIERYLALSLL